MSHQPRLRRLGRTLGLVSALLAAIGLLAAPATAQSSGANKIQADLASTLSKGTTDFWIEFAERADLTAASAIQDWNQRGTAVVDALQNTANASQASVRAELNAAGTEYKPFWIANTILVKGGTEAQAESFAKRANVATLRLPKTYTLPTPEPSASTAEDIDATEWGIRAINADDVWSTFGVRGEGIVVANIDTGVQFDHPALVRQYRGNTGNGFDHNYNWFDPSNVCGSPSLAPCDNNDHGSHTMGTMLGEDASQTNQVGVAPRAKWMAAKGCESNSCSDAALLGSGQWIVAPTRLDGTAPDPAKRPNIVNNSWGGAGGDTWYQQTVSNWRAAGIFPAFSNGNSGPLCGTAGSPGDYDISYASGAFAENGTIASFSSRGPAIGSTRIKPNIAAPGVNVRSSVRNNGYANFNGTSMASPHTAGTVALMWSAAPALVGDIPATMALLNQTAMDTNDVTCGGSAGNNNVWGEGKLDALAAVTQSPRGDTGTLVINVTNASGGAPLSGATVNVTGPVSRSAITGASGSVSFVLPVGTYSITVSAFGFANATDTATVTVGATTTRNIALSPVAGGTVSGTVTSSGGGPVANATVTFTNTPIPPATTNASGQYSIANVPNGTYSVTVTAGGCFGSVTQSVTVNGNTTANFTLPQRSDSFGYKCVIEAGGYVQGTTPLALTGDDVTATVPLPFAFNFYGTSYNTAFVATNGHINFLAPAPTPNTFSNVAIPATSVPNAAVYPFWDDLLMDSSSSAFTALTGTAPNRSFLIEWRNVTFFSSAGRVDFEAQLNEDGSIVTRYRNIGSDSVERGSSATVGIENAAGTVALQYSFNQAVLSDTQSIKFTPPPSGIVTGTVTDGNDTLPVAGATVQAKQGATVVATTTTAANGSYSLRLLLGTYDIVVSKTNYVGQTSSVTLSNNGDVVTKDFALATARGEVAPDTLTFIGNEGQLRTTQVVLRNTSTTGVAMTYTLTDDASWLFTVPGSSGSNPIPAGGSRTLTVRADASGLDPGVHRGTIVITTNSGREPVVEVAVSLIVPAYRQGVNSGGTTFTDSNGDPWGTDRAWTQGSFGYLGEGWVNSTRQDIAGTTDDGLYQTQREATSGYRFDALPAGRYLVELDFAELRRNLAPGRRVFDVKINGQLVMFAYDTVAEVGTLAADRHEFWVDVAEGGAVQVDFLARRGQLPPAVNGVRITHRPDQS